jgi:hypothetical protein
MQMRKLLLLATAAATALLTVLPMTAASAAARSHVLTITKVGGPRVKAKAVLQLSLKTRTAATFIDPKTKTGVSCKKSTITDKVVSNPTRPGTAVETLTGQTFGRCTVTTFGATGVKSIKLNKLPYRTTISDAKGNPVTVFRLSTTIVLNTILGPLSCTFGAKKIKGHASNVGQTISFSKQLFKLTSGSSLCPTSGAFSATYGPVRDLSVAHNPKVFVN